MFQVDEDVSLYHNDDADDEGGRSAKFMTYIPAGESRTPHTCDDANTVSPREEAHTRWAVRELHLP
jgi:hypothetical protein